MRLRKPAFVLFLMLVSAIVAVTYYYFRDTDGPTVALSPDSGFVSAKAPLDLAVNDAGSGLKSLVVTAVQGDKTVELLKKSFSGQAQAKEAITIDGTKIKDGPLEITVTALDNSIYRFGAGAKTEKTYPLVYDSKPPVVTVLSVAHHMIQGGAGCVVYTVNKDVKKSGVVLDDLFFPGFKLDNGNYACLFAFPYYMQTAKFQPRLVAVDQAGNERVSGFFYTAKPRNFRHDSLNITDSFLNARMSQFEELLPGAKNPLEIFLRANKELRVQNARTIFETGQKTSPKPLWDGPFMRQPNASPMAGFGDVRTYFYNNERVDEQTHLGVDLASLMMSPIPAANHGNVVFADFLGIYGNCVIIDHGLGLQSLYSHMSTIDVKAGESVTKGQTIGKTGVTGMAGGDHLHFGMYVSGVPVIPMEWWDGHWIRDNVTDKFSATPAMAQQGQLQQPRQIQPAVAPPQQKNEVTGRPMAPPKKKR